MPYHVSYRCYQQVRKTWNKVSDQARITVERHVSEPYFPSEQIQWKHTVTYPSSTSESKTTLNQIYQKNTEDDRKECRDR